MALLDVGSSDSPTAAAPESRMLFLGQPFTRRDASAAGMSTKVLRRLLGDGSVRRVLHGVFVDAAAADTLQLRSRALLAATPRNAVVCDRTAAWLYGVDVTGPAGHVGVPPIDVFRAGGDNRIRRDTCRAGTRTLAPLDIEELDGLAVTTPLRTALDLGRMLPRGEAIGALDGLLRLGRFNAGDLSRELPRFRGARGVVQLRGLVPLADARAESPAESRLRLQLHDAGLPRPDVQFEVRTPYGALVARLDLAYADLLLAIEYDGRDFHTTPEAQAHDRARRQRLRRLGWTVLVLTREDVYGPNPPAAYKVALARTALLAHT